MSTTADAVLKALTPKAYEAGEASLRVLTGLERVWTPALKRRVALALREMREGPWAAQVQRLLASGDVEGAVRALPWAELETKLDATLRPAVAAIRAVSADRHGPAMDLAFNVIDPDSVAYAARHSNELVTAVSNETRQALMAITARGARGELDVLNQAKAMRDVVGLNERQALSLLNYRAGLEARGFPASRVDTLVEAQYSRALDYRTEMIARTETIRAANAGQMENWLNAQADGLLGWSQQAMWIASPDACEKCLYMDGRSVPIGSSWTGGVVKVGKVMLEIPSAAHPPLHPNCRCGMGIREVSPAEARSARLDAALTEQAAAEADEE